MSGGASYRRPADVGVVVDPADPPRVFLAALPEGPLVVLEGSSAAIWRAATTPGPDGLVERVADATGASADEIGGEVARFVDELVARGLLEPVSPHDELA